MSSAIFAVRSDVTWRWESTFEQIALWRRRRGRCRGNIMVLNHTPPPCEKSPGDFAITWWFGESAGDSPGAWSKNHLVNDKNHLVICKSPGDLFPITRWFWRISITWWFAITWWITWWIRQSPSELQKCRWSSKSPGGSRGDWVIHLVIWKMDIGAIYKSPGDLGNWRNHLVNHLVIQKWLNGVTLKPPCEFR